MGDNDGGEGYIIIDLQDIPLDQIKEEPEAILYITTFWREYGPETTPAVLEGSDEGDVLIAEDPGQPWIIYGYGSEDEIVGGDHTDYIYGGRKGDTIDGGAGNDFIDGERGADTIFGGSGNDMINGGHADDVIYGGDGDDTLGGGEHDDTIFGDDGQDMIFGGTGNDTLHGGADIDLFVFGVNAGTDVIEDYQIDEILDFRGSGTTDVVMGQHTSNGGLHRFELEYVDRDGNTNFLIVSSGEATDWSELTINY